VGRYFCAADPARGERRCPDCASFGSRPKKRAG
jgi:hypothetical protein